MDGRADEHPSASWRLLFVRSRVIGAIPERNMRLLVFKSYVKVGTHEGTSRSRVYTMGRVAGKSSLEGLHAGTYYTSK